MGIERQLKRETVAAIFREGRVKEKTDVGGERGKVTGSVSGKEDEKNGDGVGNGK